MPEPLWLVTVCVDEDGVVGPSVIVSAVSAESAAQLGWEAMSEVDHYGVKCSACEGVASNALTVILMHDANPQVMEPVDRWQRRD